MKLNINKICFMILCSIAIGLTIVLACLSLLTDFVILKYASFTLAFVLGIYLVNVRRKYPLYIKK